MKEVKKFYESQIRSLTLEVDSDLVGLNLESVEPLWQLLEKSDLQGNFLICVNTKIYGVHSQEANVKVVGLNRMLTSVIVKFQCAPEYCYTGTLSGKDNNSAVIIPSVINQTLRAISGNSWYNPNMPMREIQEAPLTTPKPLVSVDAAIKAAVSLPEPTQLSKKREKGITGTSHNFERTKLLFEKMIVGGTSRTISSVDISDIIMMSLYGSGSDKSRKCCGSVMAAWVRKSWLERNGKNGNAVIYIITDSAMRTFGLESVLNTALNTAVAEATKKESQTPVVSGARHVSDDNLLGIIQAIREKVERFEAANTATNELNLRRTNLENELQRVQDELQRVQNELSSLRLILDDSDLQKAVQTWTSLRDLVPKKT